MANSRPVLSGGFSEADYDGVLRHGANATAYGYDSDSDLEDDLNEPGGDDGTVNQVDTPQIPSKGSKKVSHGGSLCLSWDYLQTPTCYQLSGYR